MNFVKLILLIRSNLIVFLAKLRLFSYFSSINVLRYAE